MPGSSESDESNEQENLFEAPACFNKTSFDAGVFLFRQSDVIVSSFSIFSLIHRC